MSFSVYRPEQRDFLRCQGWPLRFTDEAQAGRWNESDAPKVLDWAARLTKDQLALVKQAKEANKKRKQAVLSKQKQQHACDAKTGEAF